MIFNCRFQCYIGGKLLETVNEVEVSNDCAQLGSNCDITVPLTCRIENSGQYLIDNVRNLFKSGDTIQIYAWYDGYNKQLIFDGYLYDFLEGTPMKIRCLDYVYKLRQTTLNLNFKNTTIKAVIEKVLEGTGVTLAKPYLDFDITSISFPNMSPAACLEQIKSETKMTMSLINKELYFNIASNTLETVKLKTDVNVIGANMQKPDGAFQKFNVKAWIKNEDGTKKAVEIGDADGELREIKLYMVGKKDHQKLIDNSLEQVKLGHYKGKVTTLLYPQIDLFWAVDYTDVRYPERSGIYTARAVTTVLNREGFHRETVLAYLREK
jgi:hypothetical protein